MHPALVGRGRQRLDQGAQARHRLGRAAQHQCIAVFQPPYPAGHPGIDELGALRLQFPRMAHAVLVIGIGAVDQEVAGRQQAGKLLHGRLRGLARRQHQPDDARRRQAGNQGRITVGRAQVRFFRDQRVRHLDGAVVYRKFQARARKPARHVGAHASESDQSDFLHVRLQFIPSA